MSDATLTKVERYYRRVEKPSTRFSLLERRVLKEAPGAKKDVAGTLLGLVGFILIFAPVGGAAAIMSSPDVVGWRGQGFPIDTGIVVAGVLHGVGAADRLLHRRLVALGPAPRGRG